MNIFIPEYMNIFIPEYMQWLKWGERGGTPSPQSFLRSPQKNSVPQSILRSLQKNVRF